MTPLTAQRSRRAVGTRAPRRHADTGAATASTHPDWAGPRGVRVRKPWDETRMLDLVSWRLGGRETPSVAAFGFWLLLETYRDSCHGGDARNCSSYPHLSSSIPHQKKRLRENSCAKPDNQYHGFAILHPKY